MLEMTLALNLRGHGNSALRDPLNDCSVADYVSDVAEVAVLGAELDGFFTPGEIQGTTRAYRTEAELFPRMGHNMMLEPGWRAVAERIDAWLGTIGL